MCQRETGQCQNQREVWRGRPAGFRAEEGPYRRPLEPCYGGDHRWPLEPCYGGDGKLTQGPRAKVPFHGARGPRAEQSLLAVAPSFLSSQLLHSPPGGVSGRSRFRSCFPPVAHEPLGRGGGPASLAAVARLRGPRLGARWVHTEVCDVPSLQSFFPSSPLRDYT